jgi:hypothetical protein
VAYVARPKSRSTGVYHYLTRVERLEHDEWLAAEGKQLLGNVGYPGLP